MEMEPRKFRSDDAFPMQLVRRVRRLTDANAAHYLDAIANKSKRVHSDSRRGAAKEFGGCLAGTRGGPLVIIDFPASEGRRYHPLGAPRFGVFSAPTPSFKVGPNLFWAARRNAKPTDLSRSSS